MWLWYLSLCLHSPVHLQLLLQSFCSHMTPAWSSFLSHKECGPEWFIGPILYMPSARACWWWKHRLRVHDLVSDINHPRKQTFSIPYLHQITMEDMLDLHDRRNYPGSHHGSSNLQTATQKVTSVFINATFPLGVLDFLSVQKKGSLFLFICSSMVLVIWKSNLLNIFETVLVQLAWQY